MAARFWVNGGDALWSNINNWSLTTGGAGGQTVPSAADDVTLDGAGNVPCTLNTSARVCKTLTINGYTNTLTFDQQLSVSGSITFTTTGFTFAGATTNRLRMIAAGTWTTNGKTVAQNVEIGGTTTFTCTLADALVTSGDLFLTNTTSTIFSGAFDVSAANATVSGSQTITVSNNVNVTGLTTISDANVFNGNNWRTGGLTTTGNLTGTTTVIFNGTGTWTGAAGSIANAISINTAGTLTLSGILLRSGAASLNYTAGTVVAGSSTLSIAASCSLSTAGMSWANITLTAALTLTINSLLTATGTLTMPNAAVTFAGTAGFTVATFTNTTITATRIWTFTFGNTYTITDAFTTVSAAAQTVRFTFVSSSAGNRVVFILSGGATQDVGFADPTDLNSAAGQTIFSYHGVVTTTTNWSATIPVNVLPAQARIVQVNSSY